MIVYGVLLGDSAGGKGVRMAHRYGQTVLVTCEHEVPTRFLWRGETYRVVEILTSWRLRDRWWAAVDAVPGLSGGPCASDRTYYRVRCARGPVDALATRAAHRGPHSGDELIGELYYDAARALWVLDRVYD